MVHTPLATSCSVAAHNNSNSNRNAGRSDRQIRSDRQVLSEFCANAILVGAVIRATCAHLEVVLLFVL
jgi:hypothetical protein